MFSNNLPQESWHDFCEILGLGEDVETNCKFNSTRARAKNCEELINIIDRGTAAKPRDEWLILWRARGLICAPVNTVQDIPQDAQIAANGYVFDSDHEALGLTKTIGFPISFSRVQPQVKTGAPDLGQHTEGVLLESSYSWEEIARFRENRAI